MTRPEAQSGAIPSDPIQFIDLAEQQRRIRALIEDAIRKVLDHGKYVMGPEVAEFEAEISEFCGAREVISCSSGTDALILPLLALKIGPGDAVFVPSFTFTATAEAVALTGATPVFVDVDEHYFCMSPASLSEAIDATKRAGKLRLRAVIPVDLFGTPVDYNAIESVAKTDSLIVLADAAQSFGARYCDRGVGKLGHVTATSFFPAKPLGCYGDGGAIFTDDPDLAEAIRSIRIHGRGTGGKYDNVRIGTNARLDTIQAAVLREKLKIFPEELESRQKVADRYEMLLDGLVTTPKRRPDSTSAWAQYTIVTSDRDRLAAELKNRGIPTAIYYPRPLHMQPPYRDYPVAPDGLATTESLCRRVLSLPMHPYLTESQQLRIAAAVKEVVSR